MEENEKKCPSCGNPHCLEDDSYCWNCGVELDNRCSNPDCFAIGLSDDDKNYVVLPDEFCFCPFCGSETYYKKIGAIQPQKFVD